MKVTDIRNMTDAEIEQLVISLKGKLYDLAAEKASGRVEHSHLIRLSKRDVARCLTILRERKNTK